MLDINKLIMDAMKSRDKIASETYKMIKAKILEFKTQKNAPEYTETEEVKILQKMSKERKETAEIYNSNNRPELAEQELAQAEVIDKLIPQAPSDEEIIGYIKEKYPDGIQKQQMGLVIKELKNTFVAADSKKVAEIVKSFIL